MQQPPLLPEEALLRVLRVSRANGMSVALVSGLFAVLAATSGDYVGAIAGLVVAGAGAMEVHGGTLLNHYDLRGSRWLVSSQAVCLLGILVYCAVRLVFVQIPPLPEEVNALIAADARQLGMTSEEFVRKTYVAGFILIAVLSVFYQGGMAIYYLRRKRSVAQAILRDA